MEDQPSFITRDYFDMLARSLPNSNDNSSPPSPRRRIAQPVRSRLHPSAATSQTPPPVAEFVGSEPAPAAQSHGISETAFSPNYFEKFFVEERELGRGGRGVVLLVRHVLDGVPLGHFACKRVPVGDDHAWLEKVLVEVQLLTTLSHQNLVSYRHVWLEDFQTSSFGPSIPCAFILQQYCNGGDMHNYVLGSAQATTTTQDLKERLRRRSRGETELPRKENEPQKLHFDEIYSFFRDITSGLRFLHHNNFIHRDLKPSNCLLHSVGGETRVLVSDFGEVQYEYAARRSTGATGTISYCAPEVLRRIAPGGPYGNFTAKSDIFSLGMILHFLCFANLPYRASNVLHEENEDVDELRAEIMGWSGFDEHRKLRPELPDALYAFLKRLLSLAPDMRPTADDVLQVVTSGRLDDIPTARRKNSMEPEELTPGKRIQKLESPRQGNSPQRGLGLDIGQKTTRRSRLGYEATSADRKTFSPIADGSVGESTYSSDDSDEDSKPLPSATSRRASSTGRNYTGLNTNGRNRNGMVLRARQPSASMPTSPIQKSSQENLPQTTASPVRPQLLLEPAQPLPPPGTLLAYLTHTSNRIHTLAHTRITSSSTRLVILGVKLLSTLQPCLAYGMNATLVYPTIGVALAEFSVPNLQLWKGLLSMLLHCAVLFFALRSGRLCRAPEPVLAWDT